MSRKATGEDEEATEEEASKTGRRKSHPRNILRLKEAMFLRMMRDIDQD